MSAPEFELAELLKKHDLHITTAESLTGGNLAGTLVNVPGISAYFHEGHITYADRTKERILGVQPETIAEFGAVSAETAEEMARGAARIADADVAVSTTGNAGPDCAEGKPAGLYYVGVYYGGVVSVFRETAKGSREEVRRHAVETALRHCAEVLKEELEGSGE